jgi:HD-like signal output (HDOD) protein
MAISEIRREDRLEWLVNKTENVYSLPTIYERLTEAINHPRSSINDITKIIGEDQGLTARLLKLANSPLFGYFSKIDSIGKAVTIIGTQQLQAMSLAVSVMEVFTGIPENLINMRTFWQHSIACGITARALAIYRRETNVERVFAAGILHDVGRLVMCTAMPDIFSRMIVASRQDKALLLRLEEDRLGFTHAEVGGKLLEKWLIPLSITEPVGCHHSPDTARKFPLETAFIHVADIICKSLGLGFNGEWFVPPLDHSSWDRLDIPPASLRDIVKYVEPQMAQTMAILGGGAP